MPDVEKEKCCGGVGVGFTVGLAVIALVLSGLAIKVSFFGTEQGTVTEQGAAVVPVSDVEELPLMPLTESKELEEPEVLAKGGEAEERAEMLVLTPQQLAQANEMLAAFEGKPLNELVQVYGVMQMAAVSVSPEDRPVFEFVLAKLGVYIAELER